MTKPTGRLLLAASLAVVLAFAAVSTRRAAGADEPPAKVTYQDHVRPIFQQHCFACHSQDDRNSDLALDNYNDVIVGGASGEVVAGGDADGSRLWMLVTHQDSPEMPPGGDKLPQAQLDVIKAWIDGGLLKDAGSKPKKRKVAGVDGFVPSADNRPQGEPAMPEAQFREPVVYTDRPAAVDAADVSPWAPLAAIGGIRQVSFYHTDTGELLGVVPYPEGMPRSIRFSRDGSLLVVGGGWPAQFGNAALYDVKTGARITSVGEETDEVLTADVSPNRSLIALGGPKKVVRVYRVADGSLAYEIRKHTDWITAVGFSPDGSLLATADRGGGLYLWDGPTGNQRAELRGHSEHITAVSWRADSNVIASASEDDSVRLWQTDGKQIKSWKAHGGGVLGVDFSRDGMLATAGRDRWIKTWTVDGKHSKDIVRLRDIALLARPTHDGKHVLAADWSGRVQLFDASSGDPAAKLPANPPTLAMRIQQSKREVQQTARARRDAKQRCESLSAELAQAKSAVGDVQERREAAEVAATEAEAEQKLARLDADSDQLPCVAAIERELAAAASARDDAVAAHERAVAAHTAAVAEQQAFQQAAETLAAQVNTDQRQFADAEAQLSQVQQQHEQLLAELEQRKATADQLAEQIEQLRELLKSLRGEQREAQAAADEHAEQLEAVRASAAEAARTAALREAKLEQFRTAQQLRAEYAEKLHNERQAKK